MASSADPARLHRWRSDPLFLVFFWLFAALLLVGGVYVVVTAASVAAFVGDAALFIGDLTFLIVTNTAHIDLYPDRIEIGGFLRRDQIIDLPTLASVEPGRSGLSFRRAHEGDVLGPGLIGPKGDLLEWLHIRNRGDRIAAAIMTAADGRRDVTPGPQVHNH